MGGQDIAIIAVCAALGFGIVYNVMQKSGRSKPTRKPHHQADGSSARPHSGSGGPQGDWRKPTSEAWHEVLGVAPSASLEEAKRAHRQLAQQYHPDRYATAAPEIRDYAADKMKRINSAYQTVERLR